MYVSGESHLDSIVSLKVLVLLSLPPGAGNITVRQDLTSRTRAKIRQQLTGSQTNNASNEYQEVPERCNPKSILNIFLLFFLFVSGYKNRAYNKEFGVKSNPHNFERLGPTHTCI